MTPATATTSVWTNWVWPEDVKAFAAEHDAEQYLEPLKVALARLFPTATVARVVLELDHELRDERHVVFDVDVPAEDIPDYVSANRSWVDELFRIVPSVKVWVFQAILHPR